MPKLTLNVFFCHFIWRQTLSGPTRLPQIGLTRLNLCFEYKKLTHFSASYSIFANNRELCSVYKSVYIYGFFTLSLFFSLSYANVTTRKLPLETYADGKWYDQTEQERNRKPTIVISNNFVLGLYACGFWFT